MLSLRTIRLQSSKPTRRFEYPLARGCVACPLGSAVPQSLFTLQHKQQIRPYLFVPVSWTELKERLERWLQRSDSRIVKVILLKRRRGKKTGALAPPLRVQYHQRHREKQLLKIQRLSHGKLTKWKDVRSQIEERYNSLPLPTIQSSMSSWKGREMANNYRRWKDRQKEQYGILKSRYKSRRQAQSQKWSTKRNQVWVKIQQVLVEEYSKEEWFDELGRPLTARDSTGRFVNPWQSQSTNGVHSLATILRWRWQRFARENTTFLPSFTSPSMRRGKNNLSNEVSPLLTHVVPPLPVPNDSNLQFTWIGHSTCLFQVKKSFTILTDPIFSKRASPFKTFIGVARDVPPAYSIEDLVSHQLKNCSESDGKFDVCCITHDHYDHMDTESVQNLRDFVKLWVVPDGIGDWLAESCSIQRNKIIELQWWQQLRVVKNKGSLIVVDGDSGDYEDDDTLTITCCPSSHWGSRTLFDRNTRLWCSFAFSVPAFNVFFCGDTGYPENFPLFRQIGDTLGPFDLACIPIGAYEPRDMNKDAHCNPEEAVKIHKDLHSTQSVAIHWGSFQLTEELMDAPPRDLKDAICKEQQKQQQNLEGVSMDSPINFSTLGHGQTMVIKQKQNLAPDNPTRQSPFFVKFSS